jgi:transcriptional regulator with XRE-family HTH domain
MQHTPATILIAYRLEQRKLSWSWLAKNLNIHDSMVSHMRTGRRPLSAEMMAKVSQLLDIPLTDLKYAKAIHTGSCDLDVSNTNRRAAALAIMRVWESCSPEELGKFQRLAEKIHVAQMNDP